MICTLCLQQLQEAYKFRDKCLKVNEIWHNRHKLSMKRKQEDEDNVPIKKQHIENMVTENIYKSSNKNNEKDISLHTSNIICK